MQCLLCKEEFKINGRQKYCSMKCKLLDSIKIENDCWVWTGYVFKDKYPKVKFKNKMQSSHRASYEVFKGKIINNLCVLHNCPSGDNPKCINPEHLWLGTHKDNTIDASKKGKMKGMQKWTPEMHQRMKEKNPNRKRPILKGEKSPRSKLKDSDIYEIRDFLKKGFTHKEIGLKYGVSKHTIGNISLNRRWSHLKEDYGSITGDALDCS